MNQSTLNRRVAPGKPYSISITFRSIVSGPHKFIVIAKSDLAIFAASESELGSGKSVSPFPSSYLGSRILSARTTIWHVEYDGTSKLEVPTCKLRANGSAVEPNVVVI
jgi:hypothetical protein